MVSSLQDPEVVFFKMREFNLRQWFRRKKTSFGVAKSKWSFFLEEAKARSLGSSLNDAGKKAFGCYRLEDQEILVSVLTRRKDRDGKRFQALTFAE
jgi:hypothetical protein